MANNHMKMLLLHLCSHGASKQTALFSDGHVHGNNSQDPRKGPGGDAQA